MAFWIAQDYRTLTASEIEGIVGEALPNPSIPRDFYTGRHPAGRRRI